MLEIVWVRLLNCLPGSFEPVSDMRGGGPFDLKPGEWTDDTSMAGLSESIIERKGFDAADLMERYTRWYQEGYLEQHLGTL